VAPDAYFFLNSVEKMGHLRISRKLKIILLSGATLIAIIALMFIEVKKAPEDLLRLVEDSISNASNVGAGRYAESEYDQAQYFLQNGRLEIARQKGKLPLFRNYNLAVSELNSALNSVNTASRNAIDRKQALRQMAETEHLALKSRIESWRQALDGSLALFRAEKYWYSARLQDSIAASFIAAGEFESALQSLRKARSSIADLGTAFEEYEDDAGRKIEVWRQWVQKTLNISSSRAGFAIIIDKSMHKLYLLKKGTILRTYNCDLGYNAAHQKLFAGDGATPEGMYKVTIVKYNGSEFYKALLLDYPNQRDKRRFADNKDRGIIAGNSRIGGLIEIHGEGGRNSDWTDGCIALQNEDMDELMKYVTVNTPVTIVRRSDRWP
jgi:hypothetical protein